jgi:hypothetical protein
MTSNKILQNPLCKNNKIYYSKTKKCYIDERGRYYYDCKGLKVYLADNESYKKKYYRDEFGRRYFYDHKGCRHYSERRDRKCCDSKSRLVYGVVDITSLDVKPVECKKKWYDKSFYRPCNNQKKDKDCDFQFFGKDFKKKKCSCGKVKFW